MWEKFLATPFGQRAEAWYNRNISAGWYKSTSFLANLFGVLVAMLPDGINFVLQNSDLVTSALLPALTMEQKGQFLLFVNVAAAVFRVFKQVSVQQANIKQQAEAGQVVPLAASGVQVSTAYANATPVSNDDLAIADTPGAVQPPRPAIDSHL